MTDVSNVSDDILKSINKNAGTAPTGTETKDNDITTKYDLAGGSWVRVPLTLNTTSNKLEVDAGKAELATEAYKETKGTWKGGASKTPKRRRRAGKSKSLRRKPKTA
jgi:hypothetical protein